MYGKIFESMFEGSMVGSGSATFAVWSYVISHMKPERVVNGAGLGAHVDLNPALVAFILGEKQQVVEGVIEKLCAPDPKSRTKAEQGKRLIKLGEFDYRVVNGEYYRRLRTAEERREYQRVKQAEYRAKKGKKAGVAGNGGGPTSQERLAERYEGAGQPELAERVAGMGASPARQSMPANPPVADPGLSAAGFAPVPDLGQGQVDLSQTAISRQSSERPKSPPGGSASSPLPEGLAPGPEFLG